jgi:hypothetical protein
MTYMVITCTIAETSTMLPYVSLPSKAAADSSVLFGPAPSQGNEGV